MLLANYASDSDADSDTESPAPTKSALPPSKAPPIGSGSKVKKRAGPVRITLDQPKSSHDDDSNGTSELPEVNGESEAKRPKLGGLEGKGGGKGGSSLLGMLPPPKRRLPVAAADARKSLAVNKSMAVSKPKILVPVPVPGVGPTPDTDDDVDDTTGGFILPSSIARSKEKASAPSESSIDLFGLSSTPIPPSIPSSSSTPGPSKLSISSAPPIPDFKPPPPTSEDPYPGYYQTPSGQWQAYDPTYYLSFFPNHGRGQAKETEEERGNDGRIGKHWDEYDTRGGVVVDIDVGKGLEDARKEEERRERMKKPKTPGEEYDYKTIGQTKGLAAQRHQLTSLLHTAYGQREELEERIQQNKKNMRLAGQKYGF